jgi:predicted metalloprotease
MHLHVVRNRFAVALILAISLTIVAPPHPAGAVHLPAPSELLIRPGELPAGLEPVQESGLPSTLPDGLARQAAVTFQREAALSSEPGVRSVRQVVLAFDDRDATTYLSRFRDLMAKHQGYSVSQSSDTEFQLTRTRGDESSIVVGAARGEALVVTTVAGVAGTVGLDDAARLTSIVTARIPTVDHASAALNSAPAALPLGHARPGPGTLDLVNQQNAVSYPQPVADLPKPVDVNIVQSREVRPADDRSLDVLLPEFHTGARPMPRPNELTEYMKWLGPLMDQFWGRVSTMSNVNYVGPTLVVVPVGGSANATCIPAEGEPVNVRGLTYCPANRTIYAYESYIKDEVLAGRDWQDHEITVAVLFARTWGHHIQMYTNMITATDALLENQPDNRHLITRQRELEANCYAGLFTRYAREKGWLDSGDLEEARESVVRPSDVDTEQFATPEQRKEWFMRGYVHYGFRYCDAW